MKLLFQISAQFREMAALGKLIVLSKSFVENQVFITARAKCFLIAHQNLNQFSFFVTF